MGLRIRLDWRTFVYLVVAVLGALVVIAVFRGTETMLTRIGIGLVIALARAQSAHQRGLPLARHSPRSRRRIDRHLRARARGASGRGARAPLVEEASRFSEQLPETINELEELPLVGGYVRDNEIAEKAQEWVARPARGVHRRAGRRDRRHARERGSQRGHRGSRRHRRADRRREHARSGAGGDALSPVTTGGRTTSPG